MPIKTFRGQIADGEKETIRLSTQNGMTGYRMVKFQLFPPEAGQQNQESIVKVFKVPQTTIDNNVDFRDPNLLAAAYYQDGTDVNAAGYHLESIFDREVINQDLYLTHQDTASDQGINYYIELEQIQLNKNSQAVVTLKDIRSNIN